MFYHRSAQAGVAVASMLGAGMAKSVFGALYDRSVLYC